MIKDSALTCACIFPLSDNFKHVNINQNSNDLSESCVSARLKMQKKYFLFLQILSKQLFHASNRFCVRPYDTVDQLNPESANPSMHISSEWL